MNRAASLLLLSRVALCTVAVPTPLAAQPQSACSAAEYHQFDFWLGDWDVFDVDPHTPVAHVKVSSILDGCVLLEEYEQTDGLTGKSFSIYDSSRRVWHQTWVTNRGQLIWIEGRYANNEMVLSGVEHISGGLEKQVRGTWKRVHGEVRETAVTSSDGGKHWNVWFDLIFRPRKR